MGQGEVFAISDCLVCDLLYWHGHSEVKIMAIEVFDPWSATWLNCLTRIELELWVMLNRDDLFVM